MKQPLIALDQLINCLIVISGDGFGMADETISARLFRCFLQDMISGRWFLAIDVVFGTNHCYESWRSEVERRQLPGFYVLED